MPEGGFIDRAPDGRMIAVDPRTIVVADRLREVDPDVVAAIRAVGLRTDLHPLIIRRIGERYHLVAGAHRLQAALEDGASSVFAIPKTLTNDDARLVEIEENTIRKGLRGLERARFLAEWKRIYEQRHPETRNGAHGHNKGRNEKGIFPFSKIAAKKLDCEASTIKKSVALFRSLDDGIVERVAGTWIAEKDSVLRAISEVAKPRQAAVVEALLRTEAPAKTVKAALAELDGFTIQTLSPEDRQFEALMRAWRAAAPRVRRQFLGTIEQLGEAA